MVKLTFLLGGKTISSFDPPTKIRMKHAFVSKNYSTTKKDNSVLLHDYYTTEVNLAPVQN